MTRDQFNRVGMLNTVSSYMNQNKTIWIGVKAIGDAISEFDDGNNDIAGKILKQQTPTSGAADNKQNVRHDLEESALTIANQLSALAEVNNDANLAAQTEFTLPTLDKLADDQMEATAKSIATLATANLAALADYGITQADIDALTQLTAMFHTVKTAPRTAVATRASETATLPDLITNQTSLLRNRLDKLLFRFKKTNPEFYAGYLSARVIVDRGGSPADSKPAPAPANNVVPAVAK